MSLRTFVIGIAILAVAVVRPAAQSAPVRTGAGGSTRPTVSGGGTRLLPGTRPNLSSTIHGNVLTSTDGALSNRVVRLRDARFGHVIGTQVTDSAGFFAFDTVEPGSYIVELMNPDQTVLAASDIISVNAGDTVTAVVKLPYHTPPLAGVLGNSRPSALAVTMEAIAAGVLATTVVGTAASDRPIR